MAPRVKYDIDEFRTLIQKGMGKAEIMEEMAIKSHPTFTNLMFKLMSEDKKYYEVKDAKKVKSKPKQKVAIGKRNTLTLSSKILEGGPFGPGDAFTIKFTPNKITLALLKE